MVTQRDANVDGGVGERKSSRTPLVATTEDISRLPFSGSVADYNAVLW